MSVRICTTLEVLLALALASTVAAQDRPARIRISLEEALARAEETNESIAIAEAGVLRARGERIRARSAFFPQISGFATYTRVFASEFSGLGGGPPGDGAPPAEPCGPFAADTTLPLPVRVDTLEAVVGCLSRGGPGTFPDLADLFGDGVGPFGRGNLYDVGVSLSWPVYTGGRRGARTRIAEAGQRSAEVEVVARSAQLTLDVARAYFDAVLADRLVGIAEQALAQAERTLGVTEVAFAAGDQSEFDVLRARVARDNQRATVLRRGAEREIAFARLRTLIDVPIDQPLELTTELGDELPPAVARRAPDPEGMDTAAALRSTVRQAEETVRIQEDLLRIARAQRLPEVTLSGQYGRIAFPSNVFPGLDDFRTTASISVGAQIPIFTGGRIYADELVARADLRESRARLEQLRDFAAEDAFDTIERVNAARATFEATGSTVQEAERAYAIAELRYREGVASLLELTDTRLLLEEALANRAVAARDLQVALTRLALLPALPLEGLPGTVVDFTTGPAGAVTGAAGAVIDAAGTTSGIAPGRATTPAGRAASPAGRTGVPAAGTGATTGGAARPAPGADPAPARPGPPGGGPER